MSRAEKVKSCTLVAKCYSARMYRRQNFSAREILGVKTSKLKSSRSPFKKAVPTQQRKHCKITFILATRVSIAKCFYNKASSGTNCFVVGDSLVSELSVEATPSAVDAGRAERRKKKVGRLVVLLGKILVYASSQSDLLRITDLM